MEYFSLFCNRQFPFYLIEHSYKPLIIILTNILELQIFFLIYINFNIIGVCVCSGGGNAVRMVECENKFD